MEICIINGSPRKQGATGKILQEMAGYLKQKGAIIHFFDLADFSMKYCKGCLSCYRNGGCIIQDDGLEELSQTIAKADGIILGSPTYASNVSAQMKTLIDRGHFVLEQLLHGKYGFAVSTFENAAGGQVVRILNNLILFSGGSCQGSFKRKIDLNVNPLAEPKTLRDLHRKTERFFQRIASGKGKSWGEWLVHQLIFRVGIKPCAYHDTGRYRAVLDRWSQLGI